MKDLVFPGNVGDLDAALRWVESELPATDPNVQSALAVAVLNHAQSVAAIDRLVAAMDRLAEPLGR